MSGVRDRLARKVETLRRGAIEIELNPEETPPSRRAFQPDGAPHQSNEMACDRRAEPCASVDPGHGIVGLNEWLEDGRLLARLDSYSGITHIDPEFRAMVFGAEDLR